MLEADIQKRFFALATDPKPDGNGHGISVYKGLVHHRYEECLSSSLPTLRQLVTEELWGEAVALFMSSNPTTPYIWQMPDEFRKFVVKKKLFNLPCIKDLLWFEWMQIELAMSAPDENDGEFDKNGHYRLCNSVRLKALKYKVYSDTPGLSGRFPLLIFCSPTDGEVYYYEITKYLYDFLKGLDSGKTFVELSKQLSIKLGGDDSEIKALLTGAMQKFLAEGIVKRI